MMNKKMKVWSLALGCLIAATGVALAGTGEKSATETSKPAVTAPAKPAATSPAPQTTETATPVKHKAKKKIEGC